MGTATRQHWTQAVEAHPIAKHVVPCFVPAGKETRDVIDRVDLGVKSLRIVFKMGHRSMVVTQHELSIMGKIVFGDWTKEHPDIKFTIAYDVLGYQQGTMPNLVAVFEWSDEGN